MAGETDIVRAGAGMAGLTGLALTLAACGSSSILSTSALDVFSTSPKATTANASAGGQETTDVECPDVSVRSGAATLLVGGKPGEAEPSPLEVRYQGSILRTARECHVAGGVMTMKVGIEGRVITGPAGGPGTVDVPLRIAVVHEGINPKPIVSKFARLQVNVAGAVDRVTFTHIDPEITFPMPTPAGQIDSYIIYVGFDPVGAPPERKRPPAKRKPAAKPKQS
jgi:hypothetical protein